MVDRCEVFDMDRIGCAHCRRIPDPTATPATTSRPAAGFGAAFTARYPGSCVCGNDFHPGDAIRADGLGGYLAPCCHDLIGDS